MLSQMSRVLLFKVWAMVALLPYTSTCAAALNGIKASTGQDTVSRRHPPSTNAAREAIDAMNWGFYNITDGRWRTSDAWWLSGNALQTILDYMRATGSKDYLWQAEHTVRMQKKPLPWWPQGGGDFRADSTDDTGWWVLALVSLFDLTGSVEYLDIARRDEEYMYSYWSTSTCGGGIIQDIPNLAYKNAISNELYLKLAASLHNRIPGDHVYLERAVQSWEWFKGSGMINSENLVNDGLAQSSNGTCSNNGATTWTYNQGVIIGGLVELYRATADEEYLAEAKKIADAVLNSSMLSQRGILHEPCDPATDCNSDQAAFKGIFARDLAELDKVLDDRPYKGYLVRNAESAWLRARNSQNFYSVSWTGPFDKATIGSQASAASLLLSAL
ncbi:hypothetical protein VHEMI01327 [[Torrubiella] hemipterigena]|uniref:Glycosyl hydrolase n=1 Tax=[Torrubiella] hemipterigena TaxID=1531966 RepID=A0A0A1SLN2_9HYPO|nr:hypothetical protein VHEMI01327 [[Torrubiella] hemipterigena]